jgi:hypothetical protein
MPRPNSAVARGSPGRDDRAEGQQQHRGGDEQTHGLRGDLLLLRGADDLAAHLDAHPARTRALGQRDEPLPGAHRHVLGVADGQRQAGERDAAVLGDLRRAGRGPVADPFEPLRRGQQPVHALGDRGCGDAGRRPDDVDRLGRLAGEACGKALGGQFGLRARCRVVGRVLAGERCCRGDGRDQRDDPAEQHETTAAEGEVGKAGKWRGGAHDRVASRTVDKKALLRQQYAGNS